jgi:hypothetical protein
MPYLHRDTNAWRECERILHRVFSPYASPSMGFYLFNQVIEEA